MAETITVPSADDRLQIAVNKRSRKSGSVLLNESQKFACVILKLAGAVTQGDYPTLKTNIEAIAGIQEVNLLVDGQIPADVGVDNRARLILDAQMRIEDVPEE